MRVEYGFMAERASKMADGRHVAYGIVGRYVHVAAGQVGHAMPVSAVAELSFKSPGRKVLDTRVSFPDGTIQALASMTADVPSPESTVTVVLDMLMVPLARAGRVRVEMRENGGIWHDVCGVVLVHPAPVLPALAPVAEDAAGPVVGPRH